jgi:hypothetical protein
MAEQSAPFLQQFCHSQDFLILVRTTEPADSYRIVGQAPKWLSLYLPSIEETLAESVLSSTFPFLENFLIDAKLLWLLGGDEQLEPAIWAEEDLEGTERLLQVSAHLVGTEQVLFLEGNQRLLRDRQILFQQARQGELAHMRFAHASQKRDILFHCIVHDLATPLSTLSGCLQLLATEDLSPRVKELVQVGLRAVAKQAALVHDVLDVFKPDFGEETPTASHAPDLAACISETLRLLAPKAAWRKLSLRFEQDGTGPVFVVAERSRLERVLTNLIDNAIRHAPMSSLVLVSLRTSSDGAYVTVDDEGPGVSQELSDTLFEKFARDRRSGGKVGLGLYFCKMTIERWKGSIGYCALPVVGARFWFRLPLVTG